MMTQIEPCKLARKVILVVSLGSIKTRCTNHFFEHGKVNTVRYK